MANIPKKARMVASTALIVVTAVVAFSFIHGCAHSGAVPRGDVVVRSEVAPENMVLGPRTWEQWQAEAGWSTYSAGAYDPPQEKVRTFAQLVQARDATFILFGGSWCPDSKLQVPVVFRLFKLAAVPSNRVQLYGVDRNLKEPTHTAQQFNISRVPTLIVLSNGREIGRIVEFPVPNWEDNLISILSG